MHCPPIVERELRVAMRKLDVRKLRWTISLICTAISLFFLIAGILGGETFIRSLHPWLFVAAIYYAVINTFKLAAGMFVQERQEQTLGFLFLAGLTMPEIFLTKIAGTFLVAITYVLALIPFMAIPFLAGGISLDVFWATFWCLPNLLILALALSTFASVCGKEQSAAASLAQTLAIALATFTPAIHWLGVNSGVKMSDAWLLASPAYGPWLISKQFSYTPASDFWCNSLITLGWSIVFFVLAAVVLRRTWRSETSAYENSVWQKITPSWLKRSRQWKEQRATLLDENPFAWLASSDRHPERLAWGMVAVTAAIWLLGWFVIGSNWLTVPNFFITATLVNVELATIIMFAGSKRIGEDRRSGALEILLVTPIQPLEIINGQIEATRRQFRSISYFLSTTWLGFVVIGLTIRPWTVRALIVYFVAWSVLIFWTLRLSNRCGLGALYASLITGSPGFAVWKAMSGNVNVMSWVWIYFNLQMIFSGIRAFPSGSVLELLIFAVGVPFVFIMTTLIRQNDMSNNPYSPEAIRTSWLVEDFRIIAQSPIPNTADKRFKKWKVTDRFPIRRVAEIIYSQSNHSR